MVLCNTIEARPDYLSFTARKHPMADDQAPKPTEGLLGFDYGAPAELFPSRGWKKRNPAPYRRFDTAAAAIRFAVEEMPPPALLGICLEVDEARFGLREIHDLYEGANYPLKRRAAAALPESRSTDPMDQSPRRQPSAADQFIGMTQTKPGPRRKR
jgi:hypothetical protein